MMKVLAASALMMFGCDNTLLDHDSNNKAGGEGGRLGGQFGGSNGGRGGPSIGGGRGGPFGEGLLPISGGNLLVTSNPDVVVVSDPDFDSIWVADIKLRFVFPRIALDRHDEPGRMIEDADRRVHVVLRGSGEIATLNLGTRNLVRRVRVCAAPRGIDYDDSTGKLWVACRSGTLFALDDQGNVVETVTLHDDLRDVVAQEDNLYVSRFREAAVFHLDAGRNLTVKRLNAPSGFSPSVAWRMRPHPEGGVIVLHQAGRDGPLPSGSVPRAGPVYYNTSNFTCRSPLIRQAVTYVDVPTTGGLSNIDGGILGVDVAASPDSAAIGVAMAGSAGSSDAFSVYNPLEEVGLGCNQPIATVDHAPDGEMIAVDYSETHGFVFLERNPPMIHNLRSAPTLLSPSGTVVGDRIDRGHALYHRDAGGGIACASCHPEGADDGRTWIFPGVGPRRTQSMRTGMKNSEPFHWSGDVANFAALSEEVFTTRMGGPALDHGQVTLFAEFVKNIPAYPRQDVEDQAAVDRGRELFMSAEVGCVACHSGDNRSDNRTVFVGTGEPFQVPSLVGVAARLPLMHDGCAQTLHDRFDPNCGGGDAHGKTSHLTAAQIDDMVAYLEQL